MQQTKAVFTIAACLLICQPLTADVPTYDNLGPDDTYYPAGDWCGNLFGHWRVLAAQFEPSIRGDLSGIVAAIWYQGEGVNEFTLKLVDNDDSGPLPHPGTTVLWEQTFYNEMGPLWSCVYLDDLNGPTLNPGTLYWLWCEVPDDGVTVCRWYMNDQQVMDYRARRNMEDPNANWVVAYNEARGYRIMVEPTSLGDLNCDGVLDAFDIDPFVLALTDPDGYGAVWPDCDIMLADCNGDGVVNAFDIDPFVALVIGP